MAMRPTILVVVMGVALAGLLAGDAMTVGVGQPPSEGAKPAPAAWAEIKWPFPLDQWGTGRAFQCRAGDCDAELDRVGDLELLSDKFEGLSDGRSISVGWMNGRSRPYQVTVRYGAPRTALAIAFNDKCDVVVATV